MCAHLIAAGYETAVYNRSPKKAEGLVGAGAALAANPAEAAAGADVVFSMVGYPSDVQQVYFGDNGIIEGTGPGKVLVDMTTSSPSLAVRIAQAADSKGAKALDAPVSGGDVGAREAALAVMAGGQQEAFDRVKPLFSIMGKTVSLMGPPGSGQHTKMANQIAIAGNMIGVVEALFYAKRAGLDQNALIDIIGTGAAASWSLNNLGRRIVAGDYDPGFMITHFIKDMGIALAEAKRMKFTLPGLALAESFYQTAASRGLEKNGTQALYMALDL